MKNTVANKHESIAPTAEAFINSKGGYDIRLIHDKGETHFGFDFALETDAKYIADRINSGTKQLRSELERVKKEREWVSVKDRLPTALVNVLVCYTLHYQDFWTRGYLSGDEWTVMLWSGKVKVSFEAITKWMPLPESKCFFNR